MRKKQSPFAPLPMPLPLRAVSKNGGGRLEGRRGRVGRGASGGETGQMLAKHIFRFKKKRVPCISNDNSQRGQRLCWKSSVFLMPWRFAP